ncbi:DUF3040 domain-containing protein [Amycolatopsis sp. NPDC059021]|uniref:DUF3040 domain-containing protein n=1 Tax=Amycolatopsis sp. NPDC059021 TaxID=3346704 RepID=UPI0036716DB3
MLADHERKALDGIESELAATDPVLAASLSHGVHSEAWRWKFVEALAFVTTVLMIAVGVFSGYASLIVEGVLGTSALLGLRLLRRRVAHLPGSPQ